MAKAVVLLSGGMDSAVTAAVAASLGECAVLHVNYGQRTEGRELRAFNDIARFYGVKERLVVDISHLKLIGGSALTDRNIDVPQGDLKRTDVPVTYVPFRNAHLLSIAVSWAEVIGASEIYIGAVEEDSSGYPDCTRRFFDSFEQTANLGTKPETGIRIVTPLINLRKSDIVKKGLSLGAPMHLTWSCYKEEDEACGECDSCLLRLRGFSEAGVADPIPYRRRKDLKG
ncbi:MAG TPA: 7-cyano-7-deazaguanine synthase QueC [Deltaproteobacteria bacterium]|nr:MAG: 7-cyano-7-deazaguanine synthase QueC [Deltaproteobacteria bacterium GWA2_55_82]OGQ64251.1 MAG: 7-cyano-7-deazaguanine synthase QueC [Deltaproteobacteria bacterium RIFCSPLOWO2_02_FULL_55_12]OIJ74008.1 MAG: 7-cyano-7-deazaguanine synthase QueC [Deltaproteobacteria bacterium GWC2_55_46]HBG46614.1 7-cyano-7-deazaguanine synthase QueC [Deltaproteobacteria bacterium]HCY11378.1 7-cyano-7-deazaguanine synthase QueC [Deltaproteobacteria bacterium]